ncbi:uncharacterized protein F5891DRAFT_1025693 [Suillus fuscotomentosus]|uniref:Uncharacterized protein n=1 Tax=Suillus fuscotomentosus TaxID=1912939 RepID=A0AAD4E8T9_9AGAM|nr:uncharacterized protein F5891DRAFT_1069479 [Suillus fuscotomentosus]XP_041227415.1 uncharacterized protein F5891DRAFT_1025693 [Suillus fuscotomentosus]KAG1891746.1 hypothetical protein F5891DRAFT_1069479 [Suillus fuscotomentosus]KAG1901840.1 hypothetical protein F5891DRAFT_1025693 [Suillus fuscotomentosus]
MTEVKFSALDSLTVKPIGIYGSKEEILRHLLSLGVVERRHSALRCPRAKNLAARIFGSQLMAQPLFLLAFREEEGK